MNTRRNKNTRQKSNEPVKKLPLIARVDINTQLQGQSPSQKGSQGFRSSGMSMSSQQQMMELKLTNSKSLQDMVLRGASSGAAKRTPPTGPGKTIRGNKAAVA